MAGPNGSTGIHVDALGELARVDDAEVFWNTALGIPEAITVGGDDAVRAPGFSGAGGGLALAGGGAAGWAAKASEGGTMALRTQFLVNGAIGGTGSDISYAYQQHAHGQGVTAAGLVGNFVGGGIGAGAGSLSAPVAGTLARGLGQESTSLLAKGTAIGVNATASATGDLVNQLISQPGQGINVSQTGMNALWGATWQGINQSRVVTSTVPRRTEQTP